MVGAPAVPGPNRNRSMATRLNITTKTWVRMPDLNIKRAYPALFSTANGEWLYAM